MQSNWIFIAGERKMVWFQCEDCGDNIKKPKLLNHFRCCSASKLSCIDCSQVFLQEDADSHTQCITEAEKYGPKGQGKASSNGQQNAKPRDNSKQKPDVDITVGLSERPPWFCSLCNTKATSKQTLLLHADGKKHRAKARAHHAAKENSTVKAEAKDSAPEENNPEECAVIPPELKADPNFSGMEKKRNREESEENGITVEGDHDSNADVPSKKARVGEKKDEKTDPLEKLKWKKLISSALKSNPEGVLKLKKLMKVVAKSVEDLDYKEHKTRVIEILERKINSSSRFILDGKYVRLVATR
ncbi:hypothetical protein M569_11529 [Genlisea aurea]|uniref:U1-type domain-containing protein n=1 Tax=Genlisea aurea TaxID=192259 RepID=S8C8Q3_9LAMI|nr:hypothetical protein M569_11529 [Genlisea aurea]